MHKIKHLIFIAHQKIKVQLQHDTVLIWRDISVIFKWPLHRNKVMWRTFIHQFVPKQRFYSFKFDSSINMKYFILQQWIASCQDGEPGESADTILITPNTKDVVWESAVLFKTFQDVELIVRTSLTFKVSGAC